MSGDAGTVSERGDTVAAAELPPVRGRLTAGAPLAGMTWFATGGAAEWLFRPADLDDLSGFLAALPGWVPVTVLGVGSNLLVRDGGVPGVVIRLGGPFAAVSADVASGRVIAGGGALDTTLALTCRDAGLGGLEFFSGIPGTIGGALRMNAGAFGGEVVDVLEQAEAVDRAGRVHRVPVSALGLSYRHCDAPEDWIFTAATFRGTPERRDLIAARIEEIARKRGEAQPLRVRTGGSTFANPPGMKAWELIDRAGCRGLAQGGAQISEKHCNFLINRGGATAADIEALGEEVRRRVHETSGLWLRWEIRRIGVARDQK